MRLDLQDVDRWRRVDDADLHWQTSLSSHGAELWTKPLKKGGWADDPEEFKRLCAYCYRHVEVERELYKVLPKLSYNEQQLYLLDQKINDRGNDDRETGFLRIDAAVPHRQVGRGEARR